MPRRNGLSITDVCAAFAVVSWFAAVSPAQAYKAQVTELGATVRWHSSTVAIRIAPELKAYFGNLRMTELVTDAAAAWGGLPGVPEVLVSDGAPEALGVRKDTPSNGIYLAENWTLWPDALAVTVATFESKTGELIDADVQVNSNYAFGWLPADGGTRDKYDLLSVLTHEMGHVLGLSDTVDAPGATMWPSMEPGDTYQRDLAHDDEAGVESIYAGTFAQETTGDAGCRANGSGPRVTPAVSATLIAFVLLLTVVLSARMARSRSQSRYTIVLGGALLFGGLVSPSKAPPAPAVAQELAPGSWLPREHPVTQQRLAAFVKGAERVVKGRALTRSERRTGGLIWTRVRVPSASGVAEFDFPGGSLDGLTQIVSGHTPPREGELLVVTLAKHGPRRWAHFQDGRVYGGSLGEGPALEWE